MPYDFEASSTQRMSVATFPISGEPFTLACWAKPESDSFGTLMAISNEGSSSGHYHGLFCGGASSTNSIRAATLNGGGQASADTVVGPGTGSWIHCLGVWAATNGRSAYINGGSSGSNTTNKTTTGLSGWQVGALLRLTASNYFDGIIALPTIWNVALSTDEIAALAAGAHPLLIRPSAIVRHCPFEAAADPSIEIIAADGLIHVNSPAYTQDMPAVSYPRGRRAVYFTAAAPGGGTGYRGLPLLGVGA